MVGYTIVVVASAVVSGITAVVFCRWWRKSMADEARRMLDDVARAYRYAAGENDYEERIILED